MSSSYLNRHRLFPELVTVDMAELELRILSRLSPSQVAEHFSEWEVGVSTRDIIMSRINDLCQRVAIEEVVPLSRILEKVLPPADAEIWKDVMGMFNANSEIIDLLQGQRLLKDGRMGGFIDAIKLYRELSGSGLAEAKRAVENIIQDSKLCACRVEEWGIQFRGTQCGRHKTVIEFVDENRNKVQEVLSNLPNIWHKCPLCNAKGCKDCSGIGFLANPPTPWSGVQGI